MKRVLIVDDSSYNLFVMQELLHTIPAIHIIKTAMNGQECLDLLKENKSQVFDVIFLDIHMPILDGIQTIKILREWESKGEINLSRTRIIGLSAITTEQFKNQPGYSLFDSFMEKPINF